MSFICEKCGTVAKHGEKSQRIVVEKVIHQHRFREKANRDGSNDVGGAGTQIKREITICDRCH